MTKQETHPLKAVLCIVVQLNKLIASSPIQLLCSVNIFCSENPSERKARKRFPHLTSTLIIL